MSLLARRPTTTTVPEVGGTSTPPSAAEAGVPWTTVVPLAVVLAFANGFWLVTVRGAVGAIERTQQPFAGWLRDSLLGVPATALAVVLALAVARRLVRVGRGWSFTTVWLLVSVAAALSGVAQLVVSGVYDLVLQSRGNAMMVENSGMCTVPDCLERMQRVTLVTQLRALEYGAVLVLVTDLVVTLVVAAVAGRVDLVGRAREGAARLSSSARPVLAAALVGAAAIHAAVIREHVEEWTAAGVFFVALGLAELGLAVAVLRLPRRVPQAVVLAAVAVISVVPLVAWTWSRTVGLPFGPEPGEPEPVGASDTVSSLVELGTLVVVGVLLAPGRTAQRVAPRSATTRAVGVLAVTSLTATALQTLGLGFGPM